MTSHLTLKMPSSSRSSAGLFVDDHSVDYEQFRLDASFLSPLVVRQDTEDGDHATKPVSDYLNLNLHCPYLPGGRASSSPAIHVSNYRTSPSPFDPGAEVSLLLSYENENPSPLSVDSPLSVVPLPAPHPASLRGRNYSPRFPESHKLLEVFVQNYLLGDELGSGGYGFVMTAIDRRENVEVAVKFIVKEKVPEQAWVEDKAYGRIPMEVLVLHLIEHENIAKCLEFFEDELFFYLVSHTLSDTGLFHLSIRSSFKNFTVLPGTSATNLMKDVCNLFPMITSHTSTPRPPYYLPLRLNIRFQTLSQKLPRKFQDIFRPQFAWRDTIHP